MEDPIEGIILDVTPGGEQFEEDFLAKLNHPVLVCHGPEAKVCPLLEDGTCELLESAHGVMFQLDLDRPQHRAILRRYQEVLPDDMPIRALVPQGQEERHVDLLAGVQVWTHAPTAGDLDGFAAQVEARDQMIEDEQGEA